MTEQHAEANTEHLPEALGLKGLSEREAVMGIRFFVAARAESPEAARNLITQEIKASDKKLRLEGVYNPVLEGISIAERKDYWEKEGSPYKEALDKWHDRFTSVINGVTDETRIAAFKSILPDDPALKDKALNEIDQDDATRLFREYSENKSDIDLFMRRAITNLTAQGILQPEALQAHIAHLRWIGTGFFGKDTASMMGTQILLEVERKKDLSVAGRSVVSDFIDDNLERVNNVRPEEAEILRVVRQQAVLWEEEKKKQPVVQVPVYDDEDLLPAPIQTRGTVQPKPTPPPVAEGTQVAEDQPPVDANPPSVSTTTSTAEAGSPTTSNPSSARPRGANPAQTRGPETSGTNPRTRVETVKEIGKGRKPLLEELNDELRSTTKDNITFVVPPTKLIEYIISAFAEGKKVEVGRMEVSRDDKITVSRVKISQTGGSVTLNNITISNNPDIPGSLSATHDKIDKSILAKAFTGDVEQKISAMNDVFLTELKKRIAPRNPSWTPKSLSISKGMITVGFDRGQTTS